ncbi:hypothetical protein, partial [uncultured Parasutterella sp.]|uniref:hypothetical protein n=1 Tax=uncultured Parasutterella sp. TaxID=1263098 RepID=UPI002596518A
SILKNSRLFALRIKSSQDKAPQAAEMARISQKEESHLVAEMMFRTHSLLCHSEEIPYWKKISERES